MNDVNNNENTTQLLTNNNTNKLNINEQEKECLKELNSLMELQKDINCLLLNQKETLNTIEKNIQTSSNNIEVGKEEIKKSHKMYWKVSGPIGAGITGGIIAGPLGFYAGVKGAMLLGTTAGASVVSGFGAKIYNKIKRKE